MMLQLSDAIDSTIKDMKGIGMFSKPITVAIDKHLIPRYDKNPDEFLIKSPISTYSITTKRWNSL